MEEPKLKVGEWYEDPRFPHRRFCIKSLPITKGRVQNVIFLDAYESGELFERITSYIGWVYDMERGALVLTKRPPWKFRPIERDVTVPSEPTTAKKAGAFWSKEAQEARAGTPEQMQATREEWEMKKEQEKQRRKK